MSEQMLDVDRLSKQYRAGKEIFRDISVRFEPGRAVLLTGANGSGKTTFLKLLSTNSFPSSGVVRYGELDIHKRPYDYLKVVGLVHDEESLPLYLSAVELLEWIVRSRDGWDDGSEKRIASILDHLELDEARYEEIGTYSTGMRKKTQIAAAVITEPSILILDEPLRGLDSSSTGKALELFEAAVRRGAILLMASHSRGEEDALFDRVLQFPLRS